MSAAPQELLKQLEAARDSYAATHCGGDTVAAYSKLAEVVLSIQPGYGAVTISRLVNQPDLAGAALERMRELMRGRLPAPQSVLNLRMTPSGVVIPDEENVRRILAADPNLQGVVLFNEFSGEMTLTRPITADSSIIGERGIPRPWADADTVVLQTYIQRYIVPRMGRDKIEAVVAMHARYHCAVHPVRDYLQSLSWDGVPRLNTWLREYLGANNQPEEYLSAVGAAWLIAAVARIETPGCQADNALVFEGAQGIYKSTALRVLAGDAYFSDSLPADLSSKDARDHVRGKWILEMAELSQFKRSEIETVKSFVSRRFEQYRPSYGRHEIKFPRQCIFAGSTNNKEYLVDTTGNRRFWGVACSRIEIDAIKEYRDQLWAEAVTRFRAGEQWHLTREVEALAVAEAQLRVVHDPWTAQVAELLARQVSTPDVTPGEVMRLMMLQDSERHGRNAARVGTILRDLGWQESRRHMTRGQIYTPPPSMVAVLAASQSNVAREAAEAEAEFDALEDEEAATASESTGSTAAVSAPAPVDQYSFDRVEPTPPAAARHELCSFDNPPASNTVASAEPSQPAANGANGHDKTPEQTLVEQFGVSPEDAVKLLPGFTTAETIARASEGELKARGIHPVAVKRLQRRANDDVLKQQRAAQMRRTARV